MPRPRKRVLELNGGVGSRPQVPRWNAVRRARRVRREPRPYGAEHRKACAWRRSASFLFVVCSLDEVQRNPGAAFKVIDCPPDYASLHPGYRIAQSMIEPKTGPTAGSGVTRWCSASRWTRCTACLGRASRRENGIAFHPPPRKWGRGTTRSVVEGASKSPRRCRRRKSHCGQRPSHRPLGGPPSALSRGGMR